MTVLIQYTVCCMKKHHHILYVEGASRRLLCYAGQLECIVTAENIFLKKLCHNVSSIVKNGCTHEYTGLSRPGIWLGGVDFIPPQR